MNFIFDFDGTICDSLDACLEIINEYLTKNKKPTIEKNKFRTEGIEALISGYKLNKVQTLIYVFFSRRRISKYIPHLKPYEGLELVLKELNKNHRLGIVSSNSSKNIERFLKINNLASYFDFVYSSTSMFDKGIKIKTAMKKYGFDKDETYYVGDEVRDISAAKKADVKGISVAWGFEKKELLAKFKPDFLLENVRELVQLGRQ